MHYTHACLCRKKLGWLWRIQTAQTMRRPGRRIPLNPVIQTNHLPLKHPFLEALRLYKCWDAGVELNEAEMRQAMIRERAGEAPPIGADDAAGSGAPPGPKPKKEKLVAKPKSLQQQAKSEPWSN